jgi:glycine/D-amino acid oxidase-like deaminating enzyme
MDLPPENIYKKGISLIPVGDHIFWAGSSYEWDFKDDRPTEAFRTRTESMLVGWLKTPFRIMDHIASVRPATLERRPFVGWHPSVPRVGILNGMGTKGASLAPFYASQLANQAAGKGTIRPEADLARFSRLLERAAGS